MKFGNIEILNCDCMDYMRDCADNSFDLAMKSIILPPLIDLRKRQRS